MAKRHWLTGCALCIAIAGFGPSIAGAKIEEWHDLQGNTFKAEAEEAVGPMAVFRLSARAAKLVPFRLLAPEDCVRFYEGTKGKPARAVDWKAATAPVSEAVFRYAQRLDNGKLVRADLAGRPEPEFYVVLYGTNNESASWQSIGALLPLYPKLQQASSGDAEMIFFGLNHDANAQANMAATMKMPWLVAEFREQYRMDAIRRFAPGDNMGLLVLTRTGLPVDGSEVGSPTFTSPMLQVIGLIEAMQPGNPKSWKDRAYYLRAIQPVAFADGRSEPILVGNPLKAEGLRQRKVRLVDATLQVDADGKVTGVDLAADEKDVPPAMAGPLREALQRSAVFVPAVDHGKFVAAPYHYRLEVTP